MLSRMGYYNYQNGLIYHHLNQEGGWVEHQNNCRKLILKALDLYKPSKVTVLGSGWLLDLPFAELVERTEKLCLIDIIHPPDVVSQVKHLKNVVLYEQDVTGGLIQEVWQKTRHYSFIRKLKTLAGINIPDYIPGEDPGMIVSLNILTQLESLPSDFIKKRSKINEEEFKCFKSEVQRKHIEFLSRYKSVLVSDFAEVITSKTGDIKTITTLLTDLPDGKFREEWTWNFDKAGGDLYNSTSQFNVVGIIN
jgi:hypothetical protein